MNPWKRSRSFGGSSSSPCTCPEKKAGPISTSWKKQVVPLVGGLADPDSSREFPFSPNFLHLSFQPPLERFSRSCALLHGDDAPLWGP